MSVDMVTVLNCLRCGEGLNHVTTGRIVSGREVSTILECQSCRRHWHLHVTLSPVVGDLSTEATTCAREASCGTESGYSKHRRDQSAMCQPCRNAHAAGNRRRAHREPVTV